ncbi:hypothetical protein [Schleiferilactobacillus shenzhenensis]|uniref:Uncharacterized protein n=1 Tax=Schleiferilactobacillus shenzhenensis LY-73 TaxID=1231336 RepID=U4THH2_9LACO|nr:hypothetical protein [Schleiferilactobacillus shenzhenensis]ERL64261.1 hypothetical protein L248_1444 [Schleiferilactobacillus shenzhenensis LY-73]
MEIQVQKIVDMVPAEQIHTMTVTRTPAALKKEGLDAALGEVLDNFEASVAAGQMTQANLTVSTEVPVTFRLETNVINLPLADSNKLYQFFDLDATAPVNVYLVVESDDINVSHLRIDEVAPVTEFLSHQDQVRAQIIQAVQEKWDYLQTVEHPTPAEQAAAEKAAAAQAAAKKPATRRGTTTTRRKSPVKKTTTRKTAAAKAPAKKTTTRKTATKAVGAKTATAKKSTAKTATAKRSSTAKTGTARKSGATTTAAKASPAKKTTTRTTTAKKTTSTSKAAAKKTPTRRTRATKSPEA